MPVRPKRVKRLIAELSALLPELFSYHEDASALLEDVGRPRSRQSAWRNPSAFWASELRALQLGATHDGIPNLVRAAAMQYPGNLALTTILAELNAPDDQDRSDQSYDQGESGDFAGRYDEWPAPITADVASYVVQAREAPDISMLEKADASAAVAELNRKADEHRDRGAAALRLKGKMETGDYDVFLCYSSKNREQVLAIGDRLKERGILPWVDIWEIRPGTRWQRELQKQLKSIKSAAVFIGPRGAGPWQDLEVESLLGQIAKRNRPIIPVILEGRHGNPRLPAFLELWHVVDMRRPDPDPFEQLVWGITGERSSRF